MADIERILLYTGLGFIGTLFIMKSVRALRPASASSMSLSDQQMPYYPGLSERQKIFSSTRY